MIFSPHDGTDIASCPFKPHQRVRVVEVPIHRACSQGAVGLVMDVLDYCPHHLSAGWYLWVDIDGRGPVIFSAHHLTALPC